jgi:hypothetical protein
MLLFSLTYAITVPTLLDPPKRQDSGDIERVVSFSDASLIRAARGQWLNNPSRQSSQSLQSRTAANGMSTLRVRPLKESDHNARCLDVFSAARLLKSTRFAGQGFLRLVAEI